ncbi:hypothetical protein AB0T83_10320 [Fluviibacterium sp. DFM31]|uniref:Uncharacterized protein n=1 Tax=Meridianimarinicoccus marinus TaxID=3231483 RepID=A0ABV3L9V2_9RHOB
MADERHRSDRAMVLAASATLAKACGTTWLAIPTCASTGSGTPSLFQSFSKSGPEEQTSAAVNKIDILI